MVDVSNTNPQKPYVTLIKNIRIILEKFGRTNFLNQGKIFNNKMKSIIKKETLLGNQWTKDGRSEYQGNKVTEIEKMT